MTWSVVAGSGGGLGLVAYLIAHRGQIATTVTMARTRIRIIRDAAEQMRQREEENASLRRSLEICGAERDLMYQSLERLSGAAALVETAQTKGLLTTSARSSSGPARSPASSRRSRSKPGSTTVTRSASPHARRGRRGSA